VFERWVEKKVLITVRTYPVPSKKQIEVSCTAGITDDGKWIRLYPVPYRFLNPDKRFSKYQCIEASVMKSVSDPRPESFKVNPDTIKIIQPAIPTLNKWEMRKEKVFPLKSHSLCELEALRNLNEYPTLGFIKPKSILSLDIKPECNEWTESQLMSLHQYPMFNNVPKIELEKYPLNLVTHFVVTIPIVILISCLVLIGKWEHHTGLGELNMETIGKPNLEKDMIPI
jgi:hypothetical protein